jgi:hypothetical protein
VEASERTFLGVNCYRARVAALLVGIDHHVLLYYGRPQPARPHRRPRHARTASGSVTGRPSTR